MTISQDIGAAAAAAKSVATALAPLALDVESMQRERDSLEQQLDKAVGQREELRNEILSLEEKLEAAEKLVSQVGDELATSRERNAELEDLLEGVSG